jgi:hypothetical protein
VTCFVQFNIPIVPPNCMVCQRLVITNHISSVRSSKKFKIVYQLNVNKMSHLGNILRETNLYVEYAELLILDDI